MTCRLYDCTSRTHICLETLMCFRFLEHSEVIFYLKNADCGDEQLGILQLQIRKQYIIHILI